MEQYNWIKAYYKSQNDDGEHEVFVRQVESCSEYFISDKGNRFHVSELDLTRNTFEPHIFDISEFEKRNKEINQQYQESQAKYMEMLSKMDANSIADHKAKIDEREYWRKLRGDVFVSFVENYGRGKSLFEILENVDVCIGSLYSQDKNFFEDK